MDRIATLSVFVCVVEQRNFAAAARKLRLSPTMVSKHVAALESRLGVRLLNRTTRRTALTPAGARFFTEAQSILRSLEDAERRASASTEEVSGLLRFAAPVAFGQRYLAPVVSDFMAKHPALDLEISLDDRVVDMVRERFDAALRIGRLPDSSLIARRLSPIGVAICASPDYLAEHGRPTEVADLSMHVCVGYDHQWSGDGWQFQGRDGVVEVVRPPTIRQRSDNAEVIRAMVLGGHGLAQLPLFMVADDLSDGRLEAVLIHLAPIERAAHFVTPPGRQVSAGVRALSDFLAERFVACRHRLA